MTDKQTIADFYKTTNMLGETYEPMKTSRFSDIPTFMRAPHVTDLSGVDIGIIGVP